MNPHCLVLCNTTCNLHIYINALIEREWVRRKTLHGLYLVMCMFTMCFRACGASPVPFPPCPCGLFLLDSGTSRHVLMGLSEGARESCAQLLGRDEELLRLPCVQRLAPLHELLPATPHTTIIDTHGASVSLSILLSCTHSRDRSSRHFAIMDTHRRPLSSQHSAVSTSCLHRCTCSMPCVRVTPP